MQGGYIRQERPYVTFAALLVTQKREKKKSFFMFLRGRTMFATTIAGRRGIDTYAKRVCRRRRDRGRTLFAREEA